MSKLFQTDHIEVVTPLAFLNVFQTGSNKPMLARCLNPLTKERKDCVIKLMGAERMSPDAAARELLATFIAWEWGINIIEPVIIDVTKDFISTLLGKPEYLIASKSEGLNFGSIYIRNYRELNVLQKLNITEIDQALIIMPFDIFIGNPDRTFEKPNCGSDGNNLTILDHEIAFSFVLDIIQNPEPWEIQEKDKIWIDKLLLKHKLLGYQISKEQIISLLEKINDDFWDKSLSLIPKEWHNWQLDKIRLYLSKIVENRIKFVNNLIYL